MAGFWVCNPDGSVDGPMQHYPPYTYGRSGFIHGDGGLHRMRCSHGYILTTDINFNFRMNDKEQKIVADWKEARKKFMEGVDERNIQMMKTKWKINEVKKELALVRADLVKSLERVDGVLNAL